jgi:phosphatidylserine decarboxylase
VVGWSARRRLPRSLRRPVYTAYAWLSGADLAEVERPLEAYESLGAFFARRLASGLRPVPDDPSVVVSPCDGRVAAIGRVTSGTLLQVKGRGYALGELLGDPERAARFEGGAYATIYLSPRDYHRVHVPVDAELVGFDHLPGERYPVMPFFAERVDRLLSRNERVVVHFEGRGGPVELVMVAAIGVGNLTLTRPAVESRSLRAARSPRRHVVPAISLRAGDELGAFELGSTVVLVFSPGAVDLTPLAEGAVVRVGHPIGMSARGGGGRP